LVKEWPAIGRAGAQSLAQGCSFPSPRGSRGRLTQRNATQRRGNNAGGYGPTLCLFRSDVCTLAYSAWAQARRPDSQGQAALHRTKFVRALPL